MKEKYEQERKDEVVENVATVLLEYDGTGSDKDLISALDQKYDALKDKLLLEAIKKQLGKRCSGLNLHLILVLSCFYLSDRENWGGNILECFCEVDNSVINLEPWNYSRSCAFFVKLADLECDILLKNMSVVRVYCAS